MPLLGELSLWVALLMAAWGSAASLAGATLRYPPLVSSGERAAYVTLAFAAAAALGLLAALVRSDFSVAYVTSVTTANLPPAYKLSAFWAGSGGARLLWALLLCACAVTVHVATRESRRDLAALTTGALLALAFIALLATCVGTNPYARLDWLPPEGRGLPPPLQHPGAAIVRPVLALGYAAGAVPTALVLAAAAARRADAGVSRTARRWALVSWLCLTSGMLTAAWSAYAEVGADAYASWVAAPVVALLPWLATTGYLHGAGPGRRPARRWEIALAVAAGLFGAAAAILPPGLAEGAALGPASGTWWSVALLIAGSAAAAYILATRWETLSAVRGAPEPAGSGRGAGGRVVHCGIALLAAGASGLAVRRHSDATLQPGVSFEAADPFGRRWEFVSQGVSSEQLGNRDVTVVAVEARRAGDRVGYVRGEQRRYFDSRGALIAPPLAEVGVLGTVAMDVRAVLLGVGADETARFRIAFIPLARWIWIGGAVMVLGGMIALLTPVRPAEVSK